MSNTSLSSFDQFDDKILPTIPTGVRKIPKSLDDIVRITKFNKSEIRLLYKGFKQECPRGTVTEREFQAIYSHFFPNGNCQSYANFLFRVLDRRNRMYFTFEDYIQTLSILVRGSVKEKLQWIFRSYDTSDVGYLTKQTLFTFLRALYDLLGTDDCIHSPVNDDTVEQHSTYLFEKIDSHHVGCINFDDFEKYCLDNEQLLKTIHELSSNVL